MDAGADLADTRRHLAVGVRVTRAAIGEGLLSLQPVLQAGSPRSCAKGCLRDNDALRVDSEVALFFRRLEGSHSGKEVALLVCFTP